MSTTPEQIAEPHSFSPDEIAQRIEHFGASFDLDVMKQAAALIRAQAERVRVLEAEAENRERDAANDRAFNKGSPQAEYGQQCILEIIALSDDLIDLPEVPSINTMRALQHAAMNFHKHGFDLWALGKQLQNRTPMGTVPYATEFECATGLWVVIRDGIISARAAADKIRAALKGEA
jgi:hypothetical protein